MSLETPYIWRNGEYIGWDDATDHNVNHSLHYGSGVFEGIRFYPTKNGPKIFRLRKHIERLFYSASVVDSDIGYTVEEIMEACIETVKRSGVESGYIRPIVYHKQGAMTVIADNEIQTVVSVWPWGKYIPHDRVNVKIPKMRRLSPQTADMNAKVCGYYANSILASQEIKDTDFHEILLQDVDGHIAEGSGENIFFVKGKEVFTPKLGSILPGITRSTIIQLLKERFSIEVIEKDIIPEDIHSFDEAFFTGTAAEVTPIGSITGQDNRKTEFGIEFGKKIQTLYMKTVGGEEEAYGEWLY